MNILIAAAKTGGHIYPAVSVGSEFINKSHNVIFLGSNNILEKIIKQQNKIQAKLKNKKFITVPKQFTSSCELKPCNYSYSKNALQ